MYYHANVLLHTCILTIQVLSVSEIILNAATSHTMLNTENSHLNEGNLVQDVTKLKR